MPAWMKLALAFGAGYLVAKKMCDCPDAPAS